MKSRMILSSIMFSIVLMIFPVASGVIVSINNIDAPQSYWLQGAFMLISIVVPVITLLVTKINPNQIGFVRTEKEGLKTALYFIPIIAAKIGFLLFGINRNLQTIIALLFFTVAIGLAEEIYFRGMILRQLATCLSIKQAVIMSSVLFAAVHASQAFSGVGAITVTFTIVNALIFGIVASEIVVLTRSLIPAIIWHTLYDFINWIALVQAEVEIILIIIESIILIVYAIYLWTKLTDKQHSPL